MSLQMRPALPILMIMLALASCSGRRAVAENGNDTAAKSAVATPRQNVALADPFILLYNGKYYAYGTGAPDGIKVMISDDMSNWRDGQGRAAGNLALHKDDVWGDKHFWAPEVYHRNGKFYMYFSAEGHTCVAVADSPLGPFRQQVKAPMLPGEKSIDNSLFVDEDGKFYMYFDRFIDGLSIWVTELEDNLIQIKPGTMHKCINVSQPWEQEMGRVNEGCFVFKYNGIYFMTYSANDYRSQSYGIGCATAASPRGPWTKYDHNPLFQSPEGLVGVGHSSIFKDKAGRLKTVFHAHCDSDNVHPRYMLITDIYFRYKKGKYMMEISKDFIVPTLMQDAGNEQ